MAREINIQGATVKEQNILLPVVWIMLTFGIYMLFWLYRVNREMRDVGAALGDTELAHSNPANTVLAWFPGALIIVPALISFHNTGERTIRLQRAAGMQYGTYSMAVHWLLFIVTGSFWHIYSQSALNSLWRMLEQQGGQSSNAPHEMAMSG
jgi:hypothetical protein